MTAAVIAQGETGAAINVHPGRNPDQPQEVMELIRAEGGDADSFSGGVLRLYPPDREPIERVPRIACLCSALENWALERLGFPADQWTNSSINTAPSDPLVNYDVIYNTGQGYPKTGPPFYPFDPEHPFGIAPRTGADNLAHWIYGCRTSLMIAGAATLLASLTGIIVGLVAGFAGGVVDKVLSFIIDFFLTIPFLLAALTISPIVLNGAFGLATMPR